MFEETDNKLVTEMSLKSLRPNKQIIKIER